MRVEWKFILICGKLNFILMNEYKLFVNVKCDILIRLYCICLYFLYFIVYVRLSKMVLVLEYVLLWFFFNEDVVFKFYLYSIFLYLFIWEYLFNIYIVFSLIVNSERELKSIIVIVFVLYSIV